ncbi:hypothetical protein PG996_003028 [Apiospora saccharicola]|uniref:Uncharacterized protein n=1 Tax=Apiospora saccharicola TaxID=335842 RepID=A0ABR1W068_9PEZI
MTLVALGNIRSNQPFALLMQDISRSQGNIASKKEEGTVVDPRAEASGGYLPGFIPAEAAIGNKSSSTKKMQLKVHHV